LSTLEASLTALNKKLDWIIRRLDYLEAILSESQEYPEVIHFLRSIRFGTALYGEPLKTLDRLVTAQQLISSSRQQDEVSKIILQALALHGPLNISQLTREIRTERGKASRVTTRKRLHSLLKQKAVIKDGHMYKLPS
jgi:hypothetical protein